MFDLLFVHTFFNFMMKMKMKFFSQNLELIIPAGTVQRIEKEYQTYEFALSSNQVMEAVKNYQDLPTGIVQWAHSCVI